MPTHVKDRECQNDSASDGKHGSLLFVGLTREVLRVLGVQAENHFQKLLQSGEAGRQHLQPELPEGGSSAKRVLGEVVCETLRTLRCAL